MFCVKCGKQNSDDSVFCTWCGAKMIAFTEDVSVAHEPEPVSEPVAPVSEPVAPVSEPAVPVYEPAAPVSEPAAPVYEPAAPVYEATPDVYEAVPPVYAPPVYTPPAYTPPAYEPAVFETPVTEVKKPRKKKGHPILMTVLCLILVAALSCCWVIVAEIIPQQAAIKEVQPIISDYVDARLNCDGEAYMELFHENVIEAKMEDGYYSSEEDYAAGVSDYLEVFRPFEGQDVDYEVEVLAVMELDEANYKQVKDDCKDWDLKITAARTVWYRYTVECGKEAKYYTEEVILVQKGDDWYIYPGMLYAW